MKLHLSPILCSKMDFIVMAGNPWLLNYVISTQLRHLYLFIITSLSFHSLTTEEGQNFRRKFLRYFTQNGR